MRTGRIIGDILGAYMFQAKGSGQQIAGLFVDSVAVLLWRAEKALN